MTKNTMAWSYRKNARHRNSEKKMYGKLYATRRRGRPKMRWLDDVSTNLTKMGINELRDTARDGEAWRRIVKEAKVHPGLQRHRRRRRRRRRRRKRRRRRTTTTTTTTHIICVTLCMLSSSNAVYKKNGKPFPLQARGAQRVPGS